MMQRFSHKRNKKDSVRVEIVLEAGEQKAK